MEVIRSDVDCAPPDPLHPGYTGYGLFYPGSVKKPEMPGAFRVEPDPLRTYAKYYFIE